MRGLEIWLAAVWVLVPAQALAVPNLTVDGAQRLQTVSGVGININVNSWNGGQLRPALDALIDVEGASVMRVIRDPMDWVSTESLLPALHNLDPATLQQVYEAPKMQDIWSVIGYLNQKNLRGGAVMLNFMGWTPTWLGGSGQYGTASHITSGKETEWATMVASLVYYGRKVKNLDFQVLGPLNEEDWNCLEGPCVSPSQYVVCLKALIAELSQMGVTDVQLVSPDCAGAPDSYLAALTVDSTAMGAMAHFGTHAYGGASGPNSSYPQRSYWLTETAAGCGNCDYAGTPSQGEWSFASQTGDDVVSGLGNGLTGVFIYDGYDSFYYHHNSFGFWGLLAYDAASGLYSPRKRMYVNAQIARFVRPGFVQVMETDSLSGPVGAYYEPTGGQLTLVGHNTGTTSLMLQGALQNLPGISSLALYLTNAQVDLKHVSDVAVSGGTFAVQVPADTFFTLTTVSGAPPGPSADGGVSDAGATQADAGRAHADAGTGSGGVPGTGGDSGSGGGASAPGGTSVRGSSCSAGPFSAGGMGLLVALAFPFRRMLAGRKRAAG